MGERTNPSPSRTASTMPAVNEEQLSWLISRGTDICRSMEGSLSIIISAQTSDRVCAVPKDIGIHSSSFETLFSIASAGFPNTAFHTWVCMDINAGKNRTSRLGALEPDSDLQVMSSSTRVPIRYPSVFSLHICRQWGSWRVMWQLELTAVPNH